MTMPLISQMTFTIYYQSYFGSNDADGADGMALVFKQDSNPVIGIQGHMLVMEVLTSL